VNFRTARTTVDVTVVGDGREVYDRSHALDGHEANRVDVIEVSGPWMGRNVTDEGVRTAIGGTSDCPPASPDSTTTDGPADRRR
jgi:hypothetical protein